MWDKLKIIFREQIWDNEQVLKARQKFAELDTQTQSYVLLGSFVGFTLLLFGTFFALWLNVISLKNDIANIEENTRYVQSSWAKIEELKAQARNQSVDSMLRDVDVNAPIGAFTERVVQKALIPKAAVEIGEQKGTSVELKLNKISLRQLVRVLYMYEQTSANAVVDKLVVDTKDDPEGYIWAILNVRKSEGGM